MRTLVALAMLSGCLPGRVVYGDVEVLPIVHPANDRNRWYVVVDTVEHGEHLFFLDTGYSVTTCDDGFAEALSLASKGNVRVRGEAGILTAGRAVMPDMDVGGHRVEKFPCLTRDLNTTSSIKDPTEVPIAVVIGADLLQHFHVVIDPQTATLRLSDPRDDRLDKRSEGVVRLPKENIWGPRRVMSVQLGDRRLSPVLDTGATGTHMDGARLGLDPVRIKEGAIIRASGGDGMIVRDIHFYEEDLTLAGEQLEGVSLTGRDSPPWDDGLLGLNVLGHFRQEYDWRRGWARLLPVDSTDIPSWREWQHGHSRTPAPAP